MHKPLHTLKPTNTYYHTPLALITLALNTGAGGAKNKPPPKKITREQVNTGAGGAAGNQGGGAPC